MKILHDPHYLFMQKRLAWHGVNVLPKTLCRYDDYTLASSKDHLFAIKVFCEENYSGSFKMYKFGDNFCDVLINKNVFILLPYVYNYKVFYNTFMGSLKALFRRIVDDVLKDQDLNAAEKIQSLQENNIFLKIFNKFYAGLTDGKNKLSSIRIFSGLVAAEDNKPLKENILYSENVIKAGTWGGECVCPDGKKYNVGHNFDSCGSLACIGGVVGKCNRYTDSKWTHKKVICAPSTNKPEEVKQLIKSIQNDSKPEFDKPQKSGKTRSLQQNKDNDSNELKNIISNSAKASKDMPPELKKKIDRKKEIKESTLKGPELINKKQKLSDDTKAHIKDSKNKNGVATDYEDLLKAAQIKFDDRDLDYNERHSAHLYIVKITKLLMQKKEKNPDFASKNGHLVEISKTDSKLQQQAKRNHLQSHLGGDQDISKQIQETQAENQQKTRSNTKFVNFSKEQLLANRLTEKRTTAKYYQKSWKEKRLKGHLLIYEGKGDKKRPRIYYYIDGLIYKYKKKKGFTYYHYFKIKHKYGKKEKPLQKRPLYELADITFYTELYPRTSSNFGRLETFCTWNIFMIMMMISLSNLSLNAKGDSLSKLGFTKEDADILFPQIYGLDNDHDIQQSIGKIFLRMKEYIDQNFYDQQKECSNAMEHTGNAKNQWNMIDEHDYETLIGPIHVMPSYYQKIYYNEYCSLIKTRIEEYKLKRKGGYGRMQLDDVRLTNTKGSLFEFREKKNDEKFDTSTQLGQYFNLKDKNTDEMTKKEYPYVKTAMYDLIYMQNNGKLNDYKKQSKSQYETESKNEILLKLSQESNQTTQAMQKQLEDKTKDAIETEEESMILLKDSSEKNLLKGKSQVYSTSRLDLMQDKSIMDIKSNELRRAYGKSPTVGDKLNFQNKKMVNDSTASSGKAGGKRLLAQINHGVTTDKESRLYFDEKRRLKKDKKKKTAKEPFYWKYMKAVDYNNKFAKFVKDPEWYESKITKAQKKNLQIIDKSKIYRNSSSYDSFYYLKYDLSPLSRYSIKLDSVIVSSIATRWNFFSSLFVNWFFWTEEARQYYQTEQNYKRFNNIAAIYIYRFNRIDSIFNYREVNKVVSSENLEAIWKRLRKFMGRSMHTNDICFKEQGSKYLTIIEKGTFVLKTESVDMSKKSVGIDKLKYKNFKTCLVSQRKCDLLSELIRVPDEKYYKVFLDQGYRLYKSIQGIVTAKLTKDYNEQERSATKSAKMTIKRFLQIKSLKNIQMLMISVTDEIFTLFNQQMITLTNKSYYKNWDTAVTYDKLNTMNDIKLYIGVMNLYNHYLDKYKLVDMKSQYEMIQKLKTYFIFYNRGHLSKGEEKHELEEDINEKRQYLLDWLPYIKAEKLEIFLTSWMSEQSRQKDVSDIYQDSKLKKYEMHFW